MPLIVESRKQPDGRIFRAPPSGVIRLPNRFTRLGSLALICLAACGPGGRGTAGGSQLAPHPGSHAAPTPLEYAVPRRSGPVTIDGRLGDAAWARARWTAPFTDIEGSIRPAPRFRTRGRFVVTLRAIDKSRSSSRFVTRSLVKA